VVEVDEEIVEYGGIVDSHEDCSPGSRAGEIVVAVEAATSDFGARNHMEQRSVQDHWMP